MVAIPVSGISVKLKKHNDAYSQHLTDLCKTMNGLIIFVILSFILFCLIYYRHGLDKPALQNIVTA